MHIFIQSPGRFSALLLILLLMLGSLAFGQVSLTAVDVASTQDFNTMASTGTTGSAMPAGWLFSEAGGSAPTTYTVSTGSGTAGDTYSFGAASSTDRAFGSIASGTVISTLGAGFTNNTGATITTLYVTFTIEEWRCGTASRVDSSNFGYSTDATSLTTGTWTANTALNLRTPNGAAATGALDGNAAANQKLASATISGLSIANGATFYFRWVDVNASGGDDGLAIDDFSITPNPSSGGGPVIGKGSATVTPGVLPGNTLGSFTLKVKGDPSTTLAYTNVVLPTSWSWSHTTGDITLTGAGSPSAAVSGDTIKVTGMSLTSSDSLQIQVSNITPPDSTKRFTLQTFTGTVPDTIKAISASPSILVYGSPRPIADIKVNDANGVNLLTGQYVATRGIVSVANQFGGPGYIQDNGAGIAIYDSSITNHVSIGDEIIVVGLVAPFSGLCELTPATLIQTLSTGNTVPIPDVTVEDVKYDGASGIESYEGRLVRINGIQVRDAAGAALSAWTVSGSGTNYKLRDGVDTLDVRVDNNVDYANSPAPPGTFDIIGVVSQFKSASPFIGGYQLMPRMAADIIANGPLFATVPAETNITPTSMTIHWTSVHTGNTRVRYGTTTAYELGTLSDDAQTLDHSINMSSLTPATIYHVQAFTVGIANDTSVANDLVVSSASPATSPGTINAYFNNSVNTSVSLGELAIGNDDFVSRVINRINHAQASIDIAVYNMSGASYGDAIATALINAKNRGVSIRVICEYDNLNSTFTSLSNAGIPLINDRFDAVWNGQGLMHNKFWVFDYRGGIAESVWVWSGSWNPTQPGTASDRQNVIEFQDKALAGAYTTEFNVMWGSNTSTPNASNSRFGARKSDVAPHNFIIGGVPVSAYFSPSDKTTSHIVGTWSKAQHSICSSILTFTRKDMADTLINKKNAGAKVRVVLDNNTDTGNQYGYMVGAGIDIHMKGFSGGLLHHKYSIIDGDQTSGTPYLETGSHNWSNSAETSNDENTVIVQNSRIANLYLQEFAARYYEAGGVDSIHVVPMAIFTANKSSISFGNTIVNSSKVDSFTVTNAGNLSFNVTNVTSDNAKFTIDATTATLAGGASKVFHVTFSPTALGGQSGHIVITHDASGSPDTISVSGTAIGIPGFVLNRTSIGFGTVAVGHSKVDSFVVRNPGAGPLSITSIIPSNGRYVVAPSTATVAPADSATFSVTFSPNAAGVNNGTIAIFHNSASAHDTVTVTGSGLVSDTISSPVSILSGWNLLSLPVRVADSHKAVVYPTATSSAFRYQGGYAAADSLSRLSGYWLKFGGVETDTIIGSKVLHDSIALGAKWNLIGSISGSVPVSGIEADPIDLVTSVYYGYNGSYYAAENIEPGLGYWVKARTTGSIQLVSASNAPKTVPVNSAFKAPSGLNTLEITDNAGHKQTLYFGEQPEGIAKDLFELPPVPPAGGFDARFASNTFVEFHGKALDRKTDLGIQIQATQYPLTLKWTVQPGKLINYSLVTSTSSKAQPVRLIGEGQTTVNGSAWTLTAAPVRPLPEHFSLAQNFPNPFNPTTEISFALPAKSHVKITIYNTIGAEVATLLNEERDGGYQSITWNANVSSGIYFYRIEAVDVEHAGTVFSEIKKMALIK